MLDKKIEQARARAISRRFAQTIANSGFQKKDGACVLFKEGAICKVWLQKLRSGPVFRVAMSFYTPEAVTPVVEFADKWTYRDSPSGRKFNFEFRTGEDSVEHCLDEIREFVKTVALPWFEAQATMAKKQMS